MLYKKSKKKPSSDVKGNGCYSKIFSKQRRRRCSSQNSLNRSRSVSPLSLQSETSSSPSSNYSNHLNENENEEYTFDSPRLQYFAFPKTIMQYIFNDALVYQKMPQTCKYFYSASQILVIDYIVLRKLKHWHISSKFGEMWRKSVKDFCDIPFKFWIIGDLRVLKSFNEEIRDNLSLILPKIYRCEISLLTLQHQDLSFDEYKMLTKSGNIEYLNFEGVNVRKDKFLVAFVDILASLSNIKTFIFNARNTDSPFYFTSETFHQTLELPKFEILEYFAIFGANESINVKDYCDFMKKNCGIYHISFDPNENFIVEFSNQIKNYPWKEKEMIIGDNNNIWIVYPWRVEVEWSEIGWMFVES